MRSGFYHVESVESAEVQVLQTDIPAQWSPSTSSAPTFRYEAFCLWSLHKVLPEKASIPSWKKRLSVQLTSRSDTLLRHEIIHSRQDPQRNNNNNNNNRKAIKACSLCVQAKQRCYGGNPCTRCMQRRVVCEYRSEQGQGSLSSMSQTSNLLRGEDPAEALAEAEMITSLPSIPIAPASRSPFAESNTQALTTLLLTRSPSTTPYSETTVEETHTASWPGDIPTLDHISTEDGMFADYLPYDMRSADQTSHSFSFPFVWMGQPFESQSQPVYGLSQGVSDLCTPNNGSAAALEISPCDRFVDSGPQSHTIGCSSEARVREDLNASHTVATDVFLPFPQLHGDELQSAGAQLFGHVSTIPGQAYSKLRSFYVTELGHDDMSFPHSQLLHVFVELYFEYFDSHLPFLHPTRLEAEDLSWILLAAVATIGSQYSEVRDASKFTMVLQHLVRRATTSKVGLRSPHGVWMTDEIAHSRCRRTTGDVASTKHALTRYRYTIFWLSVGSDDSASGKNYARYVLSRLEDSF